LEHCNQIDTHTDATERNITPYSWVANVRRPIFYALGG